MSRATGYECGDKHKTHDALLPQFAVLRSGLPGGDIIQASSRRINLAMHCRLWTTPDRDKGHRPKASMNMRGYEPTEEDVAGTWRAPNYARVNSWARKKSQSRAFALSGCRAEYRRNGRAESLLSMRVRFHSEMNRRTASGARARPRVRMTASPISRMPAGSLAERYDAHLRPGRDCTGALRDDRASTRPSNGTGRLTLSGVNGAALAPPPGCSMSN